VPVRRNTDFDVVCAAPASKLSGKNLLIFKYISLLAKEKGWIEYARAVLIYITKTGQKRRRKSGEMNFT
jgi:hypothetical protein